MKNEIVVKEESALEVSEPSSVLPLIARAATDPNVSVEKMERLFALQERWEKRESEKQAHLAMIAARSEMPEVTKDTKAENHKYAKLEKIDRLAYPIYTKHGFSLQWSEAPCDTPGWTNLKCVVLHNAGHREEHFLKGPMDDKGPKGMPNKTGIQGMGSTWSYLQRRLLAMIFNIRIVGEDNDGRGFVQQQGPSRKPQGQPGPSDSPQDPKAAAKAKRAQLWEVLKDVRGTVPNWTVANGWLRKNAIIGAAEIVEDMTAEQLVCVIEKSEIQLGV